MAALDFPASPTLNQVYSANGRSWIWDGTAWNPYGSGIADGDRGDITVSAGGSQWTIDSETVTYAKMQNVSAASRLLGRGDSGSGDVEELTVGTGLSITGTTLACTVTDTGINQLTGDVTAGPGNGSQAATIANDAVTNAKLANMAAWTVKARNDVASGDPQDVTLADLTEEGSPAAGDFLLGWESGGALRKFDIGDLPGGSGGSLKYAQLGANVDITDNATLQSITGLSFSAAANTSYRIRFHMAVSASATSTGYEVGITGPASPTGYFAIVSLWNTATAETATITNSTSYGSIGTNNNSGGGTARPCEGIILFHNGANAGTVQLQGKVESAVSGTVTFETGSFMTWEEVTT
jgi:hypothetical protein